MQSNSIPDDVIEDMKVIIKNLSDWNNLSKSGRALLVICAKSALAKLEGANDE